MPLSQFIQQENAKLAYYPPGVIPKYPSDPEALTLEQRDQLGKALVRQFYASFHTAPLSGDAFIRQWATLEAVKAQLRALGA